MRKQQQKFLVTKYHTAGLLAGLCTCDVTTVNWTIGARVTNAIGGGSYLIMIIERLP